MRFVRLLLGMTLCIVALSAFGGGLFGMLGADGVPTVWLAGSPFVSYFAPSVILFVAVGGTLAAAAIAVLAGSHHARRMAVLAGGVLLLWIGAQLAIVGYRSWLQPAVAATAAIILGLAIALPGPPHRGAPRLGT